MKEKKKEKGLVGWVATISVEVAWGDLIYTFKTQSFPRTNLTIDGFDTREEALKEFCYEYIATKCQKPEEQISFLESVCRSQDIPSEHFYHWEHKQGEGWSSHTLVDDTIAEQKKEQKENVIAYPKALRLKLEVEKKIEDKLYEQFAERLKERFEKIEQRLTEIEGVLSSIGSPDYDLRKKAEKTKEDLYAASQKIDVLLSFLERTCRTLGDDIKKLKTV